MFSYFELLHDNFIIKYKIKYFFRFFLLFFCTIKLIKAIIGPQMTNRIDKSTKYTAHTLDTPIHHKNQLIK